jgi:hypothetical protein
MDVFSTACVIVEIMNDGRPLFSLDQLLQYKNKKFDPNETLFEIFFSQSD